MNISGVMRLEKTLIKPIEILLVEDNPADVSLIIGPLNDGNVLNHLNVASDGAEVIENILAIKDLSKTGVNKR